MTAVGLRGPHTPQGSLNTRGLVGLPFVEGGRAPRYGLDCWGLAVVAYRRWFGIELPRLDAVAFRRDDRRSFLAVLEEVDRFSVEWLRIERGRERPGDLLVMELAARPLHVGLVVGLRPREVLHADQDAGVIRERYDRPGLARRIARILRHPALA